MSERLNCARQSVCVLTRALCCLGMPAVGMAVLYYFVRTLFYVSRKMRQGAKFLQSGAHHLAERLHLGRSVRLSPCLL